MFNRLFSFVSKFSLINNSQVGSQPGTSAQDVLIDFTNQIIQASNTRARNLRKFSSKFFHFQC